MKWNFAALSYFVYLIAGGVVIVSPETMVGKVCAAIVFVLGGLNHFTQPVIGGK